MPEGDTIFRSARALNRALAGKVVTRFETGYAQLVSDDDDKTRRRRNCRSVAEPAGDGGDWHVYKLEICFMCGVHPFRQVRTLNQEELEQLVHTARKFLKAVLLLV